MTGLEEFEPIYAQPKAEWATNSNSDSVPLRGFLMHVFAPDCYHLHIQATDFHSNTFQTLKSIVQLEDLRDSVGIGGSWSEFIDYFVASLKSQDLKLVMDSAQGSASAKLVAQKSKGMPLISISLAKLVDSAANDAMENLSFGLFKALKSTHSFVAQEKGCSSQLTSPISVEKVENGSIHSQFGKRQRLEMMNSVDRMGASGNGSQESPDKRSARDPASKKVTNRVMPAYRRAKVRGALLQDTEDD